MPFRLQAVTVAVLLTVSLAAQTTLASNADTDSDIQFASLDHLQLDGRKDMFAVQTLAAQAEFLVANTNSFKGDFSALKDQLFKKAKDVSPRISSFEELTKIHKIGGLVAEQTTWRERVQGVFSFVNIVWVVAILMVIASIGLLFGHYFVWLVMAIPKVVYEAAAYITSALLVVIGYTRYPPHIGQFLALTGVLGYGASQTLTKALHFPEKKPNALLFSIHMCIAFGATAILLDSSLIAFFSIMCFESALGFSVIITPLCYYIGFSKRDVIPRAAGASLLLLATFTALRISRAQIPFLNIFETGGLFMGSFVYYTALLILSSDYYRTGWKIHAVTIVSGIGALVIGNVFWIQQLTGIGGTFFALYTIERYISFVNRCRAHFAWASLGIGLILYGISFAVNLYPQYFKLIPY